MEVYKAVVACWVFLVGIGKVGCVVVLGVLRSVKKK